MGLEMRITDGTNVLVDLTDMINSSGSGYVQVPGSEDSEWTTETLPVIMLSSSIDATLQALGRAFTQAKRYETERHGTPIYLEGRKRSTDAWRRSRIKGDGVSDYNIDAAIRSNLTHGSIAIERQNWWEAVDLTSVPLTNTNGTDVTTGLQIYNVNDGRGVPPNDYCNYAAISGSDIEGDLPAPVIVQLVALECQQAFVGIGANYNLTWNPIREAEEDVKLTPVADSSASGGYYANSNLFSWEISGTNLEDGAWFWPILRGHFPEGVRVDLRPSPEAQVRSYFPVIPSVIPWMAIPLEPVRLPPYPTENTAATPTIYFYLDNEYTLVDLDFIALLPADYWMVINSPPVLSTPGGFVANVGENEVYMIDAIVPGSIEGTGIYLQPGKDQRMYFLWNGVDHDITGSGTVTVSYRPRWRLL